MGLMHAGLLFLLFCSACSYQVRSGVKHGLAVRYPELEWARMETEMSKRMVQVPVPRGHLWSALPSQSTTPAPKMISGHLVMSAREDHKEVFKPGLGAGPLPGWVVNMLLGSPSNTLPVQSVTDPNLLVEMLCHVDRIYVRIKREVFKTIDAYKYLKLGKCPVNAATKIHYYFLYVLSMDCGFQQKSKANYVYISNVLRYQPTSPVLREMPFSIPLLCKYPRYFYSYKPGFYPKLQRGTFFKPLGLKGSLTLTTQDAMGNEIPGTQTYTMGEPMYFKAKAPENTGSSGDQRIYINTCFMTASPNPLSSPNYTVINNQGCMIDGKVSNVSRFLTGASKTAQSFSVGAFIFTDLVSSSSSQKLYMHCEIAIGQSTSTQSSKACNYDQATAMWTELYGDNSVCTCCDSTCPSASPRAFKTIISSHSLNIDLRDKDEYVGVSPRMRTFDADVLSLEDPYWAEHRDFLSYWEHDYKDK